MKLIIAFLIILGIVAAFAAVLMVGSLRAGLAADANTQAVAQEVEIMVAAVDLPAMSIISAGAIAQMTVPIEEVPDNAATNTVQVVGQVLTVPRMQGQPLLLNLLANESEGLHLAATLPAGGRAMSITLRDNTGIADLLYPGCLVDVIAAFRIPSGRGAPAGEVASLTLLQGLRVLAVNGLSVVGGGSSGAGGATTNIASGQRRFIVTVLVEPSQAEALQLAMTQGEVTLSLRNPVDTQRLTESGVLLSEVSEELSRRLAMLANVNLIETAAIAPIAEEVVPEEPAASEEDALAAAADDEPAEELDPTWDVVIIRGASETTKSFPVDPSETAKTTETADAKGK